MAEVPEPVAKAPPTWLGRLLLWRGSPLIALALWAAVPTGSLHAVGPQAWILAWYGAALPVALMVLAAAALVAATALGPTRRAWSWLVAPAYFALMTATVAFHQTLADPFSSPLFSAPLVLLGLIHLVVVGSDWSEDDEHPEHAVGQGEASVGAIEDPPV